MSEVQIYAAAFGAMLLLSLGAGVVLLLRRRRAANPAPDLSGLPAPEKLDRKARKAAEAAAAAPVDISSTRLARISAASQKPKLSEPLLPVAEPVAPAPAELDESSRQFVADMLAGLTAQVQHEEDMDEMRGQEPCVVRMVPQVPIRDAGCARSWLGGSPRLDPGARWPEIDGTPADFLAQFCLADLPDDIWGGLGVREGWLAIFAHPETGDIRIEHVRDAAVRMVAPNPASAIFSWTQISERDEDLPHLPRLHPEWPVDLVAVRPGDADPYDGTEHQGRHDRYGAGYDISDPALHPFDWDSMMALVDLLERRMAHRWKDADPATPAPLETQLAKAEERLREAEAAPERPDNIDALRRNVAFLPQLIAAADEARAINRDARARAEEIIAIVRETHAAGESFSPDDAAAVMGALADIEWAQAVREDDRDYGGERVRLVTLPLTRHDKDAMLWVYDYDLRHAELAKRAYCADPAALPAAVRAHYEMRWQAEARSEMPSIGHIPMGYVHEFDLSEDVTLIEMPTSQLMNWMFGDCYALVLTMKKDDLAAGAWDRVLMQITN